MRNAFAEAFYEAAKENDKLCMVVADISPAGSMEQFREDFPDRFINVGVAEQAMIGVAAGLAMEGYQPFCYTIAPFALFRPYEMIRNDLAYQELGVVVVGMGAGLSYPTLGATHQAVDDVTAALSIPNLEVIAPCDPNETRQVVRWLARDTSDIETRSAPVYLRLGKAGEPDLTNNADDDWSPYRARYINRKLGKVCIVSYGPITREAMALANGMRLKGDENVSVLTVPTLKPFNGWDLTQVLRDYQMVVVLEEASGAPLAKLLRDHAHQLSDVAVVRSLCIPDEFCHVHGTRKDLLEHYTLTAEKILGNL